MASWFLFSEWVSPIQQGSESLALLIYTTGALLGRLRRRGQAAKPRLCSCRTGNLQAQAPGGRGEEKGASQCQCARFCCFALPSFPSLTCCKVCFNCWEIFPGSHAPNFFSPNGEHLKNWGVIHIPENSPF